MSMAYADTLLGLISYCCEVHNDLACYVLCYVLYSTFHLATCTYIFGEMEGIYFVKYLILR